VIPALEKTSGLKAGESFHVAFAPERTIEGKAISELRILPQIVGGLDENSIEQASHLFESFCPTVVKVSSIEAAEMVKMINNTYRDLTFAFANELSFMCRQLGLSTIELIRAANMGYPRGNMPVPSPGVGGYCLTKDPYLLLSSVEPFGYEPGLIKRAREVNESVPKYIATEIKNFLENNNKDITSAKIFLVGFAFKGNPPTSDMRQSTTLDLLRYIRHYKARNIHGYDAVVPAYEVVALEVVATTLEQGFSRADCVVFMNDHPSLKDIDIYSLTQKMSKPALFFDGWGLYSQAHLGSLEGVSYKGL
jgi:UDP-N-acetyl-D-mannosaminuronic acid dehydrogenase